MKKIELFKGSNCWMSKMVGDMEVIELFGTDELPTPFTTHADAATVLRTIQGLNPSYIVELREEI